MGENMQDSPMERDIPKDDNGLFTDIEQLRYMAHDFVAAFSELLENEAVSDVIQALVPELGLELALKALVIHAGTCTDKKQEKGVSKWEQPIHVARTPHLN